MSSYTTGLVAANSISNLQTSEIKFLAATNFIMSPLYGKIRLWGDSVVHFDIYVVLGIGAANTNTIQVSSPSGGTPVQNTIKTSWDPMFDFGLGFKLFVSNAFAVVVDFRDYVTDSTAYGSRSFGSNFAVNGSVAFFLPTF